MIWIFLGLIIIAGISNAIMDVLKFRFNISIFKNFKKQEWWNPSISWKNKWKNNDHTQGEKFWGSSRWFVRFTDAWHFFQGMMFTTLFLSIVVYVPLIVWYIDFILIYFLFTAVFNLFYNIILIKEKI